MATSIDDYANLAQAQAALGQAGRSWIAPYPSPESQVVTVRIQQEKFLDMDIEHLSRCIKKLAITYKGRTIEMTPEELAVKCGFEW